LPKVAKDLFLESLIVRIPVERILVVTRISERPTRNALEEGLVMVLVESLVRPERIASSWVIFSLFKNREATVRMTTSMVV
jgi:hypothetical protein